MIPRSLMIALGTVALASHATAQVVVETFTGTGTYNFSLPGTPQGGGVDFSYAGALNTLTFTPGSVTFQGQPVDFSGTEASFLATTTSGATSIPVNSGPATITAPGSVTYTGPGLNSSGTKTITSLDLGAGFSATNLDIAIPSTFDDDDDLPSWNSPVVPELNGYQVMVMTTATVTSVDPLLGTVNYNLTGQVVADPGPIQFGPPLGSGCVVGAGDSLVGSPGIGAALTSGVATTATNVTVTDADNDGTVTLSCQATRDFQIPSSVDLTVQVTVDGTWTAPVTIDMDANFGVVVDPGGLGATNFQNLFPSSIAGTYSGSAGSPPFTPLSTSNTITVQGDIQMTGPTGFDATVTLPVSIDGLVFLAPAPVPSSSGWGIAVLLLSMAAMGAVALLYRTRRLPGSP